MSRTAGAVAPPDRDRDLYLRLPVAVSILELEDLADPASLRVVDVNDQSARLYRSTRDALMGRLLVDIVPQAIASGRAAVYAEVVRTGRPCELGPIDPQSAPILDGAYGIRAVPLAAERTVAVVFLDVTVQRRLEASEELNRNQLMRVQQVAQVGSWVWRLPDGPIVWSEEMARMLGRPQSEAPVPSSDPPPWIDPADHAVSVAQVSALLRDRRPRESDVRIRRPDGEIRILSQRMELGIDATGRAVEIIGVVRDVTLERTARERLEQSERLLRDAERVGGMGSWEWDLVTNRSRWSDGMYLIYGLAPQAVTMTHDDVAQRDHPDDRDRLSAVVEAARRSREPFECDHRILRADGAVRWLQSRGHVLADPGGKVTRLVGVSRDVTEERDAWALRERLAAIVESSDDAIVGKTLDNRIASWNRGAERLYGYSSAEAIGLPGTILDHPDGVKEFPALVEGVRRGEQVEHLETVRRRKDGSRVWVSLSMSPIRNAAGDVVGVSTIARDITDRRRAAEETRQAAERLRLVSRATNDLTWDWNLGTGYVWRGEATEAVIGYRREDLPPTVEGWAGLLHPEDRARVEAGIRAAIADGREFWSDEYRVRRADDTYIIVHDRAYVIRDAAGVPQRVVGSMMDVTVRRQAEERVRRSERLLARAQQMAALGSWHRDLTIGGVTWSEQTYRIFGRDPRTYTPTFAGFIEHVHPGDRPLFKAAIERSLADLTPLRHFFRLVRPDGEIRIVAAEGEVGVDNAGKPVELYGFVEDLTGRRRAEEELVRSRAQLRELAARIEATREEERTHISRRIHEELGQALTAVKLDLAALNSRLPKGARALKRRARDMTEILDRTLAITQNIALELRPGILDVLGLQAAVRWAVDDFARRTGLRCQAAVTRAPVEFDEAITNVVFRTLEESLTNVARHAEATDVVVNLEVEAGLLVLTVRDNGNGVTPGAVWGPRSLGLLGLRERARSVNGDVTVEGAPREGTVVTLRIPLAGNTT